MSNDTHQCSFCGKNKDDVLCLIAGPSSFICNECTWRCQEIVLEHKIRCEAQKLIDSIPEATPRRRWWSRSA